MSGSASFHEHPMAQASGVAKLRFERPAISTIIEQLCGVILTRGSHDSETHAKDLLLLLRLELLYGHGRTTLEIHRKTKSRIQKAGAVRLGLIIHNGPLEVPHSVWQRGSEVCGSAEKAERVKVRENGHVDHPRRVQNRDCVV